MTLKKSLGIAKSVCCCLKGKDEVRTLNLMQQTVGFSLELGIPALPMVSRQSSRGMYSTIVTIQYNIGLMNGMSECMPLTKIDDLRLSTI